MMDRRTFIAAVGGGLLTAPLATEAQQGRLPVIGVIRSGSKPNVDGFAARFGRDMQALGWEDGRNIRYIFVWADGRDDRFPALAADLVARPVDVIFVFGDPEIRAAQRATSTIPIVGLADDMVGSGFVASMARPGGNITGVSILAGELDAKRLALLHELVPHARRIGVLADPTTVDTVPQVEKAARDLGIDLVTRPAKNREEIGRALDAMIAARVGAVNVLASPVLDRLRGFIIDRVRQARLPAIYQWPEIVQEGGLVSYGPRRALIYQQMTRFVDKILKGANPGDLPVEQPTKFELLINMKTAKALGITIPQSVLLRADEVIQ
jgi:putative tryptophan/tyrosine transport system substrate-binding protein